MFHKIKNVTPLKDFKLSIQFAEGITKIYDMKKLIENNKIFADLKDINLFNSNNKQTFLYNNYNIFVNF